MASLLAKLLEVTLEDWIYILGTGLLVSAGFFFLITTQPHFDARARFVARQGLDAFDEDNTSVNLTFPAEEIEELNEVGAASVGLDPAGDERLFCLKVEDGVVSRLRFVDNVAESKSDTVSGSCSRTFTPSAFDGFVHTQPGFHQRLSEEDRSLESDIDWTCIMFDEIVEVRGEVGGLNCWKVLDTPDGHEFEPVEVRIQATS